jgi:hypothetical protein
MGDHSGALACFRHSLSCDQETRSQNQEDLEDFAISHFMAARSYYRLGEHSNAEAAYAGARKYAPNTKCLSSQNLGANCTIIVETGVGPHIRRSSLDVSIATVDCLKSPDMQVRVLLDGHHVGDAEVITDMLVQAKSHGWGAMDNVRLGKSIGRRIVSHVPLVGMMANLIRAEADTRCWHNIPRLFHVFVGTVSAGMHTITLDVRDSTGEPQPRYGQTWHNVLFSADSETLLMLRTMRNSQNHYDLEPVRLRTPEIETTAVAEAEAAQSAGRTNGNGS